MFRAVGTNDGSYVAIGGSNGYTGAQEDPTKQYVHVYVEDPHNVRAQTVSVEVRYLMESLMTEGFISGYALPDLPLPPLTQVERVAKALMSIADDSEYTDEEFRDQSDYLDYTATAKELLEGDK